MSNGAPRVGSTVRVVVGTLEGVVGRVFEVWGEPGEPHSVRACTADGWNFWSSASHVEVLPDDAEEEGMVHDDGR